MIFYQKILLPLEIFLYYGSIENQTFTTAIHNDRISKSF